MHVTRITHIIDICHIYRWACSNVMYIPITNEVGYFFNKRGLGIYTCTHIEGTIDQITEITGAMYKTDLISPLHQKRPYHGSLVIHLNHHTSRDHHPQNTKQLQLISRDYIPDLNPVISMMFCEVLSVPYREFPVSFISMYNQYVWLTEFWICAFLFSWPCWFSFC